MRNNRSTRWSIACAAALAAACAFPTDDSAKVLVLVQAPRQFLLRGAEMTVHARAVRVVGTDTLGVPNVDFKWTTDNATLATVTKGGDSSAKVTGVNRGDVTITARAVNFNDAGPGGLTLRIANPLEIDSTRPRTVRYGGVLTVYGIGVDSIFLASLGGVSLIPYPFSNRRNAATGESRLSYWVPPPATSAPLFYLGAGVFGFADSSTGVLPFDSYEPNDTTPSKINLDAGGPWPQLPLILFLNPALAFEATARGTEGVDWFDFTTTDSVSDYSVLINYPSSGDTSGTRTFILDSLGFSSLVPGGYFGRDSADFLGSDFLRCKGFEFSPLQVPRESTVVALRGLPSHSLHVLTFFSPAHAQRYGLSVVKGYVTADPRIKPDKYEGNAFCHDADAGVRRITALSADPSSFSDTLTIDNPFAVDWLRIDLPGPGTPTSVRFRTVARPFPAEADTSDIDLYVLTVPNSATSTGLTLVGADTAAGSTSDITLALNTNASYYVAVVDFAGVPTRYSLCMARDLVSPTCTPIFPGAPAPNSASASARILRRQRSRRRGTARSKSARIFSSGGLFDARHARSP